jgi:hypothetical protein
LTINGVRLAGHIDIYGIANTGIVNRWLTESFLSRILPQVKMREGKIMKAIQLSAAAVLCCTAIPAFAGIFDNDCDPCRRDEWRRERIREIRREEFRRQERRREWRIEHGYYYAPHREREHERRIPERDERCKPAIHVVGEADHLKESAKRSAIHVFQMLVQNQWGERFMDYESAEVLDEHFDIAGLGGDVITNTKRYVITARPCLRRGNVEGGPDER